jgi:hypothetical protein
MCAYRRLRRTEDISVVALDAPRGASRSAGAAAGARRRRRRFL